MMRQLSENKLVRKHKDHGKIDTAVHSLQGEIEDERRLRRHSEDLHRKLGKELSEIKSAFLKAVKDLEKEKKGNRLLEDLCDQFAMGIRNYEEELRVVKQRNFKNYELNFDKSVLHISEAWLDERMQMQNSAAKEDLAHGTTITERLSSEIQAFLLSKRAGTHRSGTGSMEVPKIRSEHPHGGTVGSRRRGEAGPLPVEVSMTGGVELSMVGGVPGSSFSMAGEEHEQRIEEEEQDGVVEERDGEHCQADNGQKRAAAQLSAASESAVAAAALLRLESAPSSSSAPPRIHVVEQLCSIPNPRRIHAIKQLCSAQ
nr:unnamed protein product [Digitaria exilis]